MVKCVYLFHPPSNLFGIWIQQFHILLDILKYMQLRWLALMGSLLYAKPTAVGSSLHHIAANVAMDIAASSSELALISGDARNW